MSAAELPKRRTVISLSLSARNADAVAVAAALDAAGIDLTRGGAQILAWAAAYLRGATRAVEADDGRIDEDDLTALLDDW